MIGSRKKVHTVFSQLEAKGTTKEQLARVHAPIGLAIGTETPEEIAVSIMTEIIQVRRQLENSKQTSK
jgi:xanthine dehydrogenase accessory factor